jgi:hypothetical protein
MKRTWETLNVYGQVTTASVKKLHIKQFQLHNILEKTSLVNKSLGEEEKDWKGEAQDFSSETILYNARHNVFSKSASLSAQRVHYYVKF